MIAAAMDVHHAAPSAGLDPKRFAGHPLRSGFATAAAANGASTWAILAITRHPLRWGTQALHPGG